MHVSRSRKQNSKNKSNIIIKNKVQSTPWTPDENYIFICILYNASYIQPLMYVLLTLHEIPKFDLIFLCVSKTFQHQEIRWRFSILRSVTSCVLELTCPVFGVCWLHKKKLFNFALQFWEIYKHKFKDKLSTVSHCAKYQSFTQFSGGETLWKRTEFQGIRPTLCRNCAFHKNLYARKLGETWYFMRFQRE